MQPPPSYGLEIQIIISPHAYAIVRRKYEPSNRDCRDADGHLFYKGGDAAVVRVRGQNSNIGYDIPKPVIGYLPVTG